MGAGNPTQLPPEGPLEGPLGMGPGPGRDYKNGLSAAGPTGKGMLPAWAAERGGGGGPPAAVGLQRVTVWGVELDDALLTLVVAAGLRAEEPISVWLRSDPDDREDLQLQRDHALLMCDGLVEYHVDSAAVLVLDHETRRRRGVSGTSRTSASRTCRHRGQGRGLGMSARPGEGPDSLTRPRPDYADALCEPICRGAGR